MRPAAPTGGAPTPGGGHRTILDDRDQRAGPRAASAAARRGLREMHAAPHVIAFQVVLQATSEAYETVDVSPCSRRSAIRAGAGIHQVRGNPIVEAGQVLAQRGRGRRTTTITAPTRGRVDPRGHKIVLQRIERTVEVFAGIPRRGRLTENGTVVISGTGADQCAWGNGPLCTDVRFLPDDGFIGLAAQDVRISEYRRVVVVSPEPLPARPGDRGGPGGGGRRARVCLHLREFALGPFPIVLTEGFGQRRPAD